MMAGKCRIGLIRMIQVLLAKNIRRLWMQWLALNLND